MTSRMGGHTSRLSEVEQGRHRAVRELLARGEDPVLVAETMAEVYSRQEARAAARSEAGGLPASERKRLLRRGMTDAQIDDALEDIARMNGR